MVQIVQTTPMQVDVTMSLLLIMYGDLRSRLQLWSTYSDRVIHLEGSLFIASLLLLSFITDMIVFMLSVQQSKHLRAFAEDVCILFS
jgi:hypothetical protein